MSLLRTLRSLRARRMMLALTALVGITLSIRAVAESIEDRIAPVGGLCMAGDACAAAAVASSAGGEPRSGETVYTTACISCHATGAAGAPKLGDADWDIRLSARGVDTLYTNAIVGYNAMPAKGLCMDCSDDEIKAAVDYILAAK